MISRLLGMWEGPESHMTITPFIRTWLNGYILSLNALDSVSRSRNATSEKVDGVSVDGATYLGTSAHRSR